MKAIALGVMATVAAISVAGTASARRTEPAADHPRPRQDHRRHRKHQSALALQGRCRARSSATTSTWGISSPRRSSTIRSKVEYVIQSSDSRIPNVLTDKVDITCQFMTVTAGRAQQVDFTIPYYREGVGLLLMKNGKYKNFDEVKAAGSAATISVLQNVYAEEMVHQALPEAKVDQYDSVDLMYQALNSGRADAAATDMSSAKWFVAQNPDQYIEGGYGWNPQTYSCAVKKGDLEFLHFVDIAFREAMTGVDFPTYAASFKKWFGEEPPAPQVGFPGEMR